MMLKEIVVLCTFSVFVNTRQLPNSLQDLRCSLKKDFEECFVRNGNIAIPIVAKGIPEYNMPNLNPMMLPFIQLISTPNLKLNITDIKVYGLDRMKIASMKAHLQEGIFTILLKVDELRIDGKYDIDGKIMIMPIKGNGDFNLIAKNAAFKVTSTHESFMKDGLEYYKPTDMRLDYKFENIIFDFKNLFDGNKKLGDEVNKFLNENWDLLVVDFGPGISKTVSDIVNDIYQEFSLTVPVQDFFLQ